MPEITILNDLISPDFRTSLDVQKSWGIRVLDLRHHIFGKDLAGLTEDEAKRAAEWIAEREMTVYCMSTGVFLHDIELGAEAFASKYDRQLEHLLRIADILRPRVFRLLSAKSSLRHTFADSAEYLRRRHPWVVPMYREAVDRIAGAGFPVTIENEVNGCIWSTPGEIAAFFRELDRPGKASLTFDVQNLWKMGTYPTMEVYRELAPLIGYYHLKGGQSAVPGDRALAWKSALEDADWPVAEMTRQVAADGVVEAICLNPSHGESKPGYDYGDLDKRNYEYVRRLLASVPERGRAGC